MPLSCPLLRKGDSVEYEVEKGEKGLQASNVGKIS